MRYDGTQLHADIVVLYANRIWLSTVVDYTVHTSNLIVPAVPVYAEMMLTKMIIHTSVKRVYGI